MRLKPTHWYRTVEPPILSVAEAVQREIQRNDYGSGQVERISTHLDQMATIIANLIQMMHDAGIVKEEQILALLRGYEKVD